MPIVLPSLIAVALYLGAAIVLAAPLTGCPHTLRRLGLPAAALAVLLHTGVLLGAHGGRIDLHFFPALSLVAAVMAIITVLVNIMRPVTGLGLIVFPLAGALLGLDVFLAPPTAPTPMPMDWQIKLHVVIALLGYSVLAIAAVLAMLLAVQERALRTRRPGRLILALPPLIQTETLLFRLIRIGFVLLSMTLFSGLLFISNIRAQHLVHTTVLTVVAWLIFGALLLGRWRYGWRGQRAVNLTLIGMAVLLLAFFGSKFVLELILHRGIDS